MRIVAFSVAHDSSVCAFNNGKLEFFAKEERLSQVKRDSIPFTALELYRSLNYGKIDKILYVTPSNNEVTVEHVFRKYIKKLFNVELENYSALKHHQSHAALAFNNSRFNESLVFVIDRSGSMFFIGKDDVGRESESVIYWDKSGYKDLYKSFWINNEHEKSIIKTEIQNFYPGVDINVNNRLSIVKVYEAATVLINQHPLENGKTMGLSSYGDNTNLPSLFTNGFAIGEYFSYLNNLDGSTCFFGEEHLISDVKEDSYQHYADRAKQVQVETQREALRLIKTYTDQTGIKNVCLVGGYALNVVANNYFLKNCPDLNFYFEPVADDTGVSIGACILKNLELNNSPLAPLTNNFYHYYNTQEIITVGRKSSIEEVCNLLINQKSVAIFEGNPEAGPRALGHRSILFDARNLNAKQIVNKIKKREWYRPFAGVILESEFKNYFNNVGLTSSEFMTVNFECKSLTKEMFPGVIHVDNTCRVQTVKEGFLFDLLTHFNKKTKTPLLLNTSFNLAGKPLVQTKKDALYTLENSDLDFVYFVDDNILVGK